MNRVEELLNSIQFDGRFIKSLPSGDYPDTEELEKYIATKCEEYAESEMRSLAEDIYAAELKSQRFINEEVYISKKEAGQVINAALEARLKGKL